jgi:folate-binding protein YgfZ
VAVARLIGPKAIEAAEQAGLPLPDVGRAVAAQAGGAPLVVVRPPQEPAPFALEIQCDGDARSVRGRLAQAGALPVTEAALELSRLLAGWPRLGAEIDEKTLPQEVRFDDIGAVSYTKGCYVGQETVARLHFRGHANRWLVGLTWAEPPEPANDHVVQDERTLGRVTTAAWVEPWRTWVGLAKVRRELDRARSVTAAGAPATIVPLPFGVGP